MNRQHYSKVRMASSRGDALLHAAVTEGSGSFWVQARVFIIAAFVSITIYRIHWMTAAV